jgi:hypothetical protein
VADFRGGPTPSYDQLDPARRLIPWAYFEGIVDDLTEDTWVAIALNGTVVGIGQALPLDGTTSGTLSTVLAPQLVEQGPNEITLWALSGDPSAPTLQSLPVYSGPGE